MNYNCIDNKRIYIPPNKQSTIYKGGTLIINNKPFISVPSSLYLNHKKGDCNIIENPKYSSYERYLEKRKRKI